MGASMSDEPARCPWKIHWGVDLSSTSQCAKPEHMGRPVIDQRADGKFGVLVEGDPVHEGTGAMQGQVISWKAGDRREYLGEWPGYCQKMASQGAAFHSGCVFHEGHHGKCVP